MYYFPHPQKLWYSQLYKDIAKTNRRYPLLRGKEKGLLVGVWAKSS
jgi:hypothetical protein